MNESYTEKMVKQKPTSATKLKRNLLLIMTGSFVLLGVIFPISAFFAIIMIAADCYFIKRIQCVEYEYLYYNGDLDIDCITGREKRKRVFETTVKNLEVLAPTGSNELKPYQHVKSYDYSSNTGAKTYELVTVQNGVLVKVIFEPNDIILQSMRMYAPRKVVI